MYIISFIFVFSFISCPRVSHSADIGRSWLGGGRESHASKSSKKKEKFSEHEKDFLFCVILIVVLSSLILTPCNLLLDYV